MSLRSVLFLSLSLGLAACTADAPPPVTSPMASRSDPVTPAPVAPAAPKPDSEKTVLDVALDSPNHTTLVAAVKGAGKADALASPGGIYTVFAPTNAAFDLLPPGTVEGLLAPEKKNDLKRIVQHHATVPIVDTKDMKDGQTLSMSDGTLVTLHVKDGTYRVDDANIVASVHAVNGVVHIIDRVLLPPAR